MSITSIETVILRAIGETEFATRLIANFKEAVSEYKLSKLEQQAVETFVTCLRLDTANGNYTVSDIIIQPQGFWAW